MDYRVLKPYETYSGIISKIEKSKAELRSFVELDFQLCLQKEGFTDLPFVSVHNEMYRRGFSLQNIGSRMERFIMQVCSLTKPLDRESGDAISKGKHLIEIKCASCYKPNPKFFIKEIRPFHNVTHYIIHLYEAVSNQCWWLLIPANELYPLCEEFDYFNSSTHGTKTVNKDNIHVTRQFCIQTHAKVGTKSRRFWDRLQQYSVSIKQLRDILQKPHTQQKGTKPKRRKSALSFLDELYETDF